MRPYERFAALVFLCGSLIGARAQRLDSLIAVNADRNPVEKTWLHFDKAVYAPGETVWFKAYLKSAFQPSDISKAFYADWTDEDGNLLFHTVAPILEGTAHGQFVIPQTFHGDRLCVHAYTRWMLNSDSAFLFSRNLRVSQAAPKAAPAKREYGVGFFPESGNMLPEANNVVAFKATDQWGFPATISGAIVDSKGTKVDSIVTIHDGMGTVTVSPIAGEALTAIWKDPSGAQHHTQLPAPESRVAFSIHVSPGRRNFLVQRAGDVSDDLKTLYLVATMEQQLVYRVRVNLLGTTAMGGSVPVGSLPSGILVFSLFDRNWKPLAERISFVNNSNYEFSPQVQVSQDMKRHGKTSIEIEVPDSASATMSLAVTDADGDPGSQETIRSHLLLTSELHGYIHHPDYYFSNASDTMAQQFDLVMLTNGWRRINWQQLVSGIYPTPKHPRDTAYLSFSGKVRGASSAQLREAQRIDIMVRGKDSSVNVRSLPILSDGSFSDPNMVFYDTVHLYYKFGGRTSLRSATAITFDNGLYSLQGKWNLNSSMPFSPLSDTAGFARSRFYAEEAEKLAQLQRGLTLKGVTVRTWVKTPMEVLDEKYTSGFFAHGDGKGFDVSNDPRAISSRSVLHYLQGHVAGLQVYTARNPPRVTWRGSTTTLYLNEIAVDADQILDIPMSDVAYIKVFRGLFFGGGAVGNQSASFSTAGNGTGGAIAVYTRKGDEPLSPSEEKTFDSRSLAGYSPYRQFYSPDYAGVVEHADQPDLRSTLYWDPYVQTDPQNHHVVIQFYNNDVSRRFRITLEGMDREGKLTHVERVVE